PALLARQPSDISRLLRFVRHEHVPAPLGAPDVNPPGIVLAVGDVPLPPTRRALDLLPEPPERFGTELQKRTITAAPIGEFGRNHGEAVAEKAEVRPEAP